MEQAHRSAVLTATDYLERNAAWARRGKGGAVREPAAGLLMAQFDHLSPHESRGRSAASHPLLRVQPRAAARRQLGAIVSRELYAAQKAAGAIYRRELASALERQGHWLDRHKDGFRLSAIPSAVERAFSKRPQAIEHAARTHGYSIIRPRSSYP